MLGTESAMPTSAGVMSTPAPTTTTPEVGGQNVSTAPPVETPAVKADPQPTGLASVGKKNAAVANPAAVAPYQPNFKFKVLDKEHEFDDFLKGAVKDAETEKKARELYEKAYGLDSVKQDRQSLKTELSESKEKIARTDQALETIGEFARQKDFDSFFEALSIPKEQILQYALQLVQREQDPNVKAQWEANRNATLSSRNFQQQSQDLQQRQQQFSVQQRTFELDQVVSRADITPVAQAYNAGMGNPGAFREYVIRIGQAHAASGSDISAEQAVTEAVRHLRAVNPTLGQMAVTPPSQQVVAPSNKPVIPNMGGRGTSPVRPTIKSFDDLKQRSKELNGVGF